MIFNRCGLLCAAFVSVLALSVPPLRATDPPQPVITNLNISGTQRGIRIDEFYPAAQGYTILSATNAGQVLTTDTNFNLSSYFISKRTNGVTISTNFGYEWRKTNVTTPAGFYQLQVTPMASNALVAANVLNRLTYGPTPDEIQRINSIGADAYIAEQLAPWTITEDCDNAHTNIPFLQAKFVEATNQVYSTNAMIWNLRAWHVLRAVNARRQFLEILLQFLENHFVTQWSKSEASFFATYYSDGNSQNANATQLEYLENEKWRAALLNPQCTFYDLLKISAESPAMLTFLDTVASRGDAKNIANENYAREIMELFTMGVDNGYDQTDVTTQSRIWTGWRIDKVDFVDAFNPFAVPTTNILAGSTNTSTTTKSNLYGAWAFNYKGNFHSASNKEAIFTNKFVPSRFGPPWTTKTYYTNTTAGLYQLTLPGHTSSLADTNGISEGYMFMTNIADFPFTEEYISIKLCRLLVHDDFPNPSNDPANLSYGFYNYAAGGLSPEAQLVHDCMMTWETNSPKGQIWQVLKTITDSELFRSHGGSMQKVKTPLEFAISTVRALRSSTNGSGTAGSFTAFTDGYDISGTNTSGSNILVRAGNMLLFDRDAPDGYPENGPSWISGGTLAERIRFAQSFCIAMGQPGHTTTTNDAGTFSGCDIVGLLKNKTPSTTWTNAPAVADYFLGILFPGVGAGNLALYKTSAINYLNDGSTDSPVSSTPFANLTVSSLATSAYDQRLRGMVGMLMGFQRFQEQ
jgi:uncharacterized protein (DUF1800 family)